MNQHYEIGAVQAHATCRNGLLKLYVLIVSQALAWLVFSRSTLNVQTMHGVWQAEVHTSALE